MKNRVFRLTIFFLVLFLGFASIIQGADDKRGTKKASKVYKVSSTLEGGKKGDAYAMNINNFYLPFNRKGIMADVSLEPFGRDGKFPGGEGSNFLFSSGFFLSGMKEGELFANAVASASLVEDYLQGTVADGSSDPRAQIYVVNDDDPPFGQAWIDWSDAVEIGADFYDGDGDGEYNPVDLNGNGEWDPDEDRPDLIGNETAWMVYWDALPAGQRRWNTIDPVGIEVRQSIFGFASAGAIGNMLFVRYRFKYVGLGDANEPDELTDCYFGVWADPDVGDAADDLVGSDMERNAGYVYNEGSDAVWGNNPPVFMIDFFSGPVDYVPGETFEDVDGDGEYTDGVDVPLDTAYSIRGQVIGVTEFPGARNQGLTSFVQYINGDNFLRDPDNAPQARNYMLGKDIEGEDADPCNWTYSEVFGGVDCATVNPNIWYNGDPVTNTGWINVNGEDVRMMQNTGPFNLTKGEENEIMVAYIVGQGTDNLNSITAARDISDGAQFIFDINFLSPAAPPRVEPTIATSDTFIDITWNTSDQVNFVDQTDAWDNRFEGYLIHAYKTRATNETVGGERNKILYKAFDLKNELENIYIENLATGGTDLLYEKSEQLNPEIYSDPDLGRIRLRITQDPFTGRPLIKGKPYYFSISSYAVNYDALINRDTDVPGVTDTANYYLDASAFTQNVENLPRILSGPSGSAGIIVGEDVYTPPIELIESQQTAGASTGIVTYDVLDKDALTGDTYEVKFRVDSLDAGEYTPIWSLTNTSTSQTLIDSSQDYLFGSDNVALGASDGFIMRIQNSPPTPGALVGETSSNWYHPDSVGVHYLPGDNAQANPIPVQVPEIGGKVGTFTRSDQLRKIEIRFSEGGGKAYRYINGIIGGAFSRPNSFAYAGAVTEDDTVGTGPVGMLGEGFVDVPFTAWVNDPILGEERQLAVGFIERSEALGGNPDGIWDPDTNIIKSLEYIIIFNSDYDPNGNHLVYKGGFDGPTGKVWADLRGGIRYRIPNDAPVSDEDRAKAASPLFDAIYAVGLERLPNQNFSTGDKLQIEVAQYPYTDKDIFQFTTSPGGELTKAEEEELFDKVNVFPNPLFGFNPATSWTGQLNNPDEPFVTFSNLPTDITIKIFSLSGQLLRTLNTEDKDSPTSPFLRWDLLNESGLRVASGLYLAIVSSPIYGDKVLKFSIIMPQKQLEKF